MKNWDQSNEIHSKQEYENLRREVLQSGLRGHDLALFLSPGMMAWLEALTALASRPVLHNGQQESINLPSVVRPNLTKLIGQYAFV
jgi:hypothetical protein